MILKLLIFTPLNHFELSYFQDKMLKHTQQF